MTVFDVPCPNRQSLEAFLDDSSNPANEVGSHVRECKACQRVLDELCSDGELDRIKRQLTTGPTFDFEAKCQELVSHLTAFDTRNKHSQQTHNSCAQEFVSMLPPLVKGDFGALDHYRVIREIGRGGMSIVYGAIDGRLQRSVAIKVLRPTGNDVTSNQRFIREATAVAAISHPNVISIHHVEMRRGSTSSYLVMELVRGPSLQEWIKQNGIVPPRTAAIWIAQVAKGLSAAHLAGIVHRDIKSSNILLSPIESLAPVNVAYQPKLADFGLAQSEQLDLRLTQSGYLTGTPAYASPEQIQSNEASPLSDIYSLGITLYEALTGELPFRGAPLAVIQQISLGELTRPGKLNPNVPTDLETICLKAVNLRAALRYQTALEFAEDLTRWLEGRPILARPSSWIEHAWRWAQRNRRVASLLATIFGLLLTIASGGILSTLSISKARNELALQVAAAVKSSNQAQMASQMAISATQSAKEQRQLALDSLNTLSDQVRTKLASRPGTLKLREELLRAALSGLDRVTSGEDAASIDHFSINARIQMADLKSILGDSQGAREDTEQVIEIASKRLELEPEDATALSDYALALTLRADSTIRTFGFEDAKKYFQEILAIYQRLREKEPDELTVQRGWISVQQKLANIDLRTSKLESAREQFQRILEEVTLLKERFPNRIELERDHYSALTQLSSTHLTLGLPNVLELQTQAIEMAERLAQQEPENTVYAIDLANLLARVSRYEISKNNSDSAISFAKRALAKYEQYAAQDPSNVRGEMLVGTAWDALFQAYLNGEQLENAKAAAITSFNTQLHVSERDPKTTLYLILAMEAASRVGDTQFRMGKYPDTIEWFEKATELLEQIRLKEDYSHSTFDPLRELYIAFLEAIRSATVEGYVGRPISDEPCVRVYRDAIESVLLAQRGDHARALAKSSLILQKITAGETETKSEWLSLFPISCCLQAASAAAISHRELVQRNNGDVSQALRSDVEELEKSKTLATALLNLAILKNPGLADTIRGDPVFRHLR